MEKEKETILAFSEWLDKNTDGYFMYVTKDDQSGVMMSGDVDKVICGLASGLIEKEHLRYVITEAANIAATALAKASTEKQNKELN